MLPLVLLAASLLPSQQISTHCVDSGASIASTETQPVRGPSGASAVLRVSTSDDHSKESHLCNAEYQLLFTPSLEGAPVVVDLLTADDDYGRGLSLRLDGFSQDGKRVLGIFSESNKRTATSLFDYDATNGGVHLVDLKQQFAPRLTASCSPSFRVLGTSETGAVVLELSSTKPCPSSGRWVLDRATGRPLRPPPAASILGLYEFKDGAR
ncbi:MAG TPA: hypothetical protein VGP19_08265 [Candidatus Acidoferrales bacterium]|jgi:hypothetical protein|nr:hypothetical protein [Candidatus Acidoferrales bacterium]